MSNELPEGAYVFPMHIGDIDEFHWRAAFEDEDPRLPVLLNARRMVRHARMGLEDLVNSDDADRRELGFYNVAIYGRSVTIAAQNCRTGYRAAFDDWYKPFEKTMRNDELMLYFLKLRNVLLKAVPPPILHSPGDDHGPEAIAALNQFMNETPKPSYAQGFIIDILGKSGWQVRLPDGETYIVDTPVPDYVKHHYLKRSHLPNAPRAHLGKQITDRSLEGLSTLYVEWLTLFVAQLGVWASRLIEAPSGYADR